MRRIQLLGIFGLSLMLAVAGFAVLSLQHTPHAKAATTIVVNSKNDTAANDGVCTLREAIVAANTDSASGLAAGECAAGSGTDTINFAITGAASFTIGGQSGYTISPATQLPDITQPVIIDGYSQTGAQANTAIAPAPLNGRLLIQVEGSLLVGSETGFILRSTAINSTMRGLVLNRFPGPNIFNESAGLHVYGNYIGTGPTGMTAPGSYVGITSTGNPSSQGINSEIGSLNPADRNIISGNNASLGAAAGYPASGAVIRGNYIGVGADGLTPISNAFTNGSGQISIDDSADVTVGGSQPGAINVISGGDSHGLAPDDSTNVTIEGNYIGLGYDGTTIIGNVGSGIALSHTHGSIKNNRIAGSGLAGIDINDSDGIHVTGNIVYHNNTTPSGKAGGISIGGGNGNVIGGLTESDRNVFYGNADGANVGVTGFGTTSSGNIIQGNYIGVLPSTMGSLPSFGPNTGILLSGQVTDTLVGGTTASAGNIIRANTGAGILITALDIDGFGVLSPTKQSIIGNSIYDSAAGSFIGSSLPGLGIDLITAQFDGGFSPLGILSGGPTPNDATDVDSGPNNYTNFPVLHTAKQVGTTLNLTYDLDAADSPSNTYRVEFFANDTADASGYGEGQSFLGAMTATNGTGKSASITVPASLNLAGKSISATTTAIDATTPSGFGSTSEFSSVLTASYSTATLADTGQNTWAILAGAFALIVLGGTFYLTHRSRS